MYLYETDIFSFRIKAENLSHVTTFELPSSYASQLSYASFCGNGNLFTVDLFRLSNVILGGS